MLPIDFHQILIILPAFNEGKALEKVIRNIRRQGFIHICVVDDGSSDDTAIVAKNTDAIVLSHVLNRGAGAASQTGLSYALKKGYKQAILMDSDGQHLPEDIFRLTKIMEENQADLVIGNRFSTTQNEVPKHRIFYNNIANVFTNFFAKKIIPIRNQGFVC
jgi:glycosyltransferase involved in cell wall biosynthesis